MSSLYPCLITIGSADSNEAPQKLQSIEGEKLANPSNGNPEFAITIPQNRPAMFAKLIGGEKRPLDIDRLKELCPEFADKLISIQNANPNKKIDVKFNLDPVVFDLMMKFLENSNKLSNDELENYALGLLIAAYKYQIDSLKTYCDHFLSKMQFSSENVLNYLVHAAKVNAPKLRSACFKYIHQNFNTISQTFHWNRTIRKHPTLFTLIYRVKQRKVDFRNKFTTILIVVLFIFVLVVELLAILIHEQGKARLISAKAELSAYKESYEKAMKGLLEKLNLTNIIS